MSTSEVNYSMAQEDCVGGACLAAEARCPADYTARGSRGGGVGGGGGRVVGGGVEQALAVGTG